MRTSHYLSLCFALLLAVAVGCDAPVSEDDTRLPVPDHTPEWVPEATLYEIYVRDFTEEGTFEAMIPRLDELQEMGINTLWLMPIHPIGEEERKGTFGSPYAVRDYYAVHEDYGTEEDFQALVDAAHERDMKVILDLVANHTAWDHAWAEEHPDWYTQDDEGNFVIPEEDWTDVIELDYANTELREEMTSVMRYWVEEFGVDGYRADVAELVPADFWEDAIAAVREVNPDVMMLAEGEEAELYDVGFDLTYSWEMYRTLIDIFQEGESAADLQGIAEDEGTQLKLRFITNHDETAYDAPPPTLFNSMEGSKAAAAALMSLPGVPLLYNGQEVGVDETLDFFEDNTIDFDANPELRDWYTNYLNVRQSNRALVHGTTTWLIPGEANAVIYSRETPNQTVIVMVNVRNQNTVIRFPSFLQGAVFEDLLTGDEHRSVEAVLAPYQVRLFQITETP